MVKPIWEYDGQRFLRVIGIVAVLCVVVSTSVVAGQSALTVSAPENSYVLAVTNDGHEVHTNINGRQQSSDERSDVQTVIEPGESGLVNPMARTATIPSTYTESYSETALTQDGSKVSIRFTITSELSAEDAIDYYSNSGNWTVSLGMTKDCVVSSARERFSSTSVKTVLENDAPLQEISTSCAADGFTVTINEISMSGY